MFRHWIPTTDSNMEPRRNYRKSVCTRQTLCPKLIFYFTIKLNTNEGRYTLTTEGDLQIVQLHRTDSGTYVCVADNGIGDPVTREVSLTVTGKLVTLNYF